MFRTRRLAFQELTQANPASVLEARAFAARVDLDQRIRTRIAWECPIEGARDSVAATVGSLRPRNAGRRVRRLVVAGAAVASAVVAVAASPALGFLKQSVLPFIGLEPAPKSVQLDFSSLATGAPAGMDPRALAEQARKVIAATFGGGSHTLWVAPTTGGGFCYEWTPGYGGCNADRASTLDAIGEATTPAGVTAPSIAPGGTDAEKAAAIAKGHALATVTPWLVGYITGDGTQSLRVTFSDGTSAQVPLTWVSAPISAGFYSYDVPPNEQTATNHVVSVEALAPSGSAPAS